MVALAFTPTLKRKKKIWGKGEILFTDLFIILLFIYFFIHWLKLFWNQNIF